MDGIADWVVVVIQALMGIIIWFLKAAYMDIKLKQKEQDRDLLDIREHYFKKEDWKDFRNELWLRLDRMEKSFEDKIKCLKNNES